MLWIRFRMRLQIRMISMFFGSPGSEPKSVIHTYRSDTGSGPGSFHYQKNTTKTYIFIVLHLWCEYFYRLPPSLPRYRERWKGRKRHWNNNKEWCHQACNLAWGHLRSFSLCRRRGAHKGSPPHPYPIETIFNSLARS
jgi:hypothetical protein